MSSSIASKQSRTAGTASPINPKKIPLNMFKTSLPLEVGFGVGGAGV